MRIRWQWTLPVVALLLFSLGSYESFAHPVAPRGRYVWWSSIPLDSDPLGRHATSPNTATCDEGGENCLVGEPITVWVDPGWLARILVISSGPAFIAGAGIVRGLSKFGVSEVVSFLIAMPLLLGSWFYFVGWVVDRWRARRPS